MKKVAIFDGVCVVIILAGIIGGLLLPVTGKLVLVDELCGGIAVLGTGLWLCKIAVNAWRAGNKKNGMLFSALTALLIAVSIVMAKDAVLDLMQGSTTVTLSDCSVEKRGASRGIISLDYYLTGTDEQGNTYTFEISGEDYMRLENKPSVTVEGYVNTGRVITYR